MYTNNQFNPFFKHTNAHTYTQKRHRDTLTQGDWNGSTDSEAHGHSDAQMQTHTDTETDTDTKHEHTQTHEDALKHRYIY